MHPAKGMRSNLDRPEKDACLVTGMVIIKHKLNLSDEETVLKIQKNTYMQFFVGLPARECYASIFPVPIINGFMLYGLSLFP